MEPTTDWPLWGKIFAGFGVFAMILISLGLFSTFGGRPTQVWTAEKAPSIGSLDFRRALEFVVGAPMGEGGRAELLRNGDAFLPAILEAASRAEQSINWMVYIWHPGEMCDQVTATLLAAAKRGVEVRIMLDGFGAMEMPDDHFDELKKAGAQVEVFRPLSLFYLGRLHRRNHRRAIIIDGRTAFVGGAAIADFWLGNAQDGDHWRDDMVSVTGSLVPGVQMAFASLWGDTVGEILVGEEFYPPPNTGLVEREGETAITRHFAISSSPSSENHPLRKLFFLSFAGARKRIWITNPYFVPDAAVLNVLIERAERGVDVRLLTSSYKTDNNVVRWASQHYYEKLLAAGGRVYEYEPTLQHAKSMVIDGMFSIVGSANLDVRSKQLNEENVLAIEDVSFADELEKSFEDDLAHSEEILLDRWKDRSLWHRLRSRLCATMEEQL